MIDTKFFNELLEQQITVAINQQVSDMLSNNEWKDQIEQKVIKHIQSRVLARFNDVSLLPDLVKTVEISVGELIRQGQIPNVSPHIDQTRLQAAIDVGITNLVESTIDHLVIDPQWLSRVERTMGHQMAQRVAEHITSLDVNGKITDHLNDVMHRWQEGFLGNFQTPGITDQASLTQITVTDQGVSVKNDLSADSAVLAKDLLVGDTLRVENLFVQGRVNVDNAAWGTIADIAAKKALDATTQHWRHQLVNEVLELAKTQGVEFSQVLINGEMLVDQNTLASSIQHSDLRSVGPLESLEVKGRTSLADTVTIDSKKLGINTSTPDMALTIWDEETSIIAGKLERQVSYIGTAGSQHLVIGTDKQAHLEISPDGLITVRSFRIGQNRISFANQVPGYSGNPGDIVFNSNPQAGKAFAWICQGAFSWQALKGA